jgi:hypothetical protein
MTERLQRDLDLVRARYPEMQFREDGQWIFLPRYPIATGWEHAAYAICFQIRAGYPDISPYGINVSPPPRGAGGQVPQSYVDTPDPKPPFDGSWGRFSWEIDGWKATPDLVSGSILLNYVESIRKRFEEGP